MAIYVLALLIGIVAGLRATVWTGGAVMGAVVAT
jgi:hypothetical protein